MSQTRAAAGCGGGLCAPFSLALQLRARGNFLVRQQTKEGTMSMIVSFGKHCGRTAEEVILKDPAYVSWAMNQPEPGERLAAFCEEVSWLIGIFDRKPFVQKCTNCPRPATRCTLYKDSPQPMFWCDQCNPYTAGASPGRLRDVRSYWDAYGFSRRDDVAFLIRALRRPRDCRIGSRDRRPRRSLRVGEATFFSLGPGRRQCQWSLRPR